MRSTERSLISVPPLCQIGAMHQEWLAVGLEAMDLVTTQHPAPENRLSLVFISNNEKEGVILVDPDDVDDIDKARQYTNTLESTVGEPSSPQIGSSYVLIFLDHIPLRNHAGRMVIRS